MTAWTTALATSAPSGLHVHPEIGGMRDTPQQAKPDKAAHEEVTHEISGSSDAAQLSRQHVQRFQVRPQKLMSFNGMNNKIRIHAISLTA